MTIEICIGSSCHIKGAYDVVETLKSLVKEHNLESKVELKACFCMGHCGDGVSLRINNKDLVWLKPNDCEQFFQSVLQKLS